MRDEDSVRHENIMRHENSTKHEMGEEMRWYAYWLCCIEGIGIRTQRKLLKLCETPRGIYEASEKCLEQALSPRQLESLLQSRAAWQLQEAYGRMKAQGIDFWTLEDDEYPWRLKNIPDPPYGLFARGRLPAGDGLSVAVIGARDCSEYGGFVARELGRYLGENGVQVISGMARGIDGISQEAALSAGGASFGVLGCGVDICYPAQNKGVYGQLLSNGGILSTYPPGTPPVSRNFPPRNRIVSGLADAVVVIEARHKSGTLITVDMALEQGRDVYVVPGRVTDRLSDGCNNLLRQGAGVFLSPAEFLEEIRENFERRYWKRKAGEESFQEAKSPQEAKSHQAAAQGNISADSRIKLPRRKLPPELEEIYQALDFYPRSIEEIRSSLPGSRTVSAVSALLMRLCLEDAAVQVSPGHFCLKRAGV